MEIFIIQVRTKTVFYLELISIRFSQATKFSKCLGNCCFIVKNHFSWKHRSLKLEKAELYLEFKSQLGLLRNKNFQISGNLLS